MKSIVKSVISLIVITGITSCATGSSYEPIVDGPDDFQYQKDLYACRQLSEKREYLNGDTGVDAAVGGVIGGVTGASSGNILGGAALGSAIGAGARMYMTKEEKKHIITTCLARRGYNVID